MESMLAILVAASILASIIAVARDQVARRSDGYGGTPARQRVASSVAIAFLVLMVSGVIGGGYEGQTNSAVAEATTNIGFLATAAYWYVVRRESAARSEEQRTDAPSES